jgi:hypothetical protein
MINPTGSASNRADTEFIYEVKDSNKKETIIPFEYSTEQAYMLEFGDGYIRFYKDGGVIRDDNNQPYEIASPYLQEDLPMIKHVQSADTMYLTHPNYAPRTLVRNGHADWTLDLFNHKNGPFMRENEDEKITVTPFGTSGQISLTSSEPIFSEGMIGSLFKISHDVDGYAYSTSRNYSGLPHVKGSFSNVGDVSSTIYCFGNWTINLSCNVIGKAKLQQSLDDGNTWVDVAEYSTENNPNLTVNGKTSETVMFRLRCTEIEDTNYTVDYDLTVNQGVSIKANDLTSVSWRFTTQGTWDARFHIQKSEDEGETWKTIESYAGAGNVNVATSGQLEKNAILRAHLYDYNSGKITYNFFIDSHTHNGIVKITGFTDGSNVTAEVITEPYSIDPTSYWSKGSWSVENGFPICADFYDDRLCLASTKKEPQTIWCSQTGDYPNFGVSSEVQDTDRISLTLISRKVNQIRNMVGLDTIIALTSAANWVVGSGNSGDAFTPSNKRAACQGYRGSSNVQPAIIENRIIYLQAQNNTIRDLGYSWESECWAGDSISIMADHLFAGHSISEMAYQQDPHSIVWFVRDDGILIGLTYLKEQQVLAWHWHQTEGQFESVAVIPGNGYDETWFVVKRGDKRFIERMKFRMESTKTEDQFFMDCGLSYYGDPVSVLSGIDHLEGKTVVALANGFVVNDLVVTNGQITLPFEATTVHAGLPYEADFEPLNIEVALNTGTSQGLEKHISELTLRLENTLGGSYGRDFNHLDEIKYDNDYLGNASELFTGDKVLSIVSDWSADTTFCVRQSEPLPITILAAIIELEFGK